MKQTKIQKLREAKIQKLHEYMNHEWSSIFTNFMSKATHIDNYYEALGYSYEFSPVMSMVMSYNSSLFSLKKAAAMYFWYKGANPCDHSIIRYFKEYERCVNDSHPYFNSNYGVYAYAARGLRRCADVLMKNKASRQATLCINSNTAMGAGSIDKICTNALQFFIRDNTLQMIVQMRSSNFVTLLPYDAFMFSVFYFQVYSTLRETLYADLSVGFIKMQVASLHVYDRNIDSVMSSGKTLNFERIDYDDKNWQITLEKKLYAALNDDNIRL